MLFLPSETLALLLTASLLFLNTQLILLEVLWGNWVCSIALQSRDQSALSLFYKSYILFSVEYCLPIWSITCPTFLTKYSIVNFFFFFAIVRFRIPELRAFFNEDIIKRLNIKLHRVRCVICDLLLLYKIVNGHIHCKTLLSQSNFREPNRSRRNVALFYANIPRNNFIQSLLINRMTMEYNFLLQAQDIFLPLRALFRCQINKLYLYILDFVVLTSCYFYIVFVYLS